MSKDHPTKEFISRLRHPNLNEVRDQEVIDPSTGKKFETEKAEIMYRLKQMQEDLPKTVKQAIINHDVHNVMKEKPLDLTYSQKPFIKAGATNYLQEVDIIDGSQQSFMVPDKRWRQYNKPKSRFQRFLDWIRYR